MVAADGGAAALLEGEDEALGGCVEAAFAAEVEDVGGAVEDGGDDAVAAGEVAGGGGADLLAGVEEPGFGEAAE